MDQNAPGTGPASNDGPPTDATSSRPRRFGATRVRPRIEVGRPKPEAASTGIPLTPDVLEPGMDAPADGGMGSPFSGGFMPFGGQVDQFGPRSFAGGRVRVYGCSPGCLVASLVVSIILTILLNAIF